METGQLVTNDKGETAWWDGKNLSPVRIEPGTTGIPSGKMTITDEAPRGQIVTNAQGHEAWWDGKNLTPTQTPRKVEPTPTQTKEPLFMEKHGLPRPPGAETMSKIGPAIGQFVLGMTPAGRVAQMGLGGTLGALEPAETLGERVGNAAIGAITPLAGEVGGKIVKGAAKFAGQAFGGKAIPKAAGAIMDEAKALTNPMGALNETTRAANTLTRGTGRTTVQAAVEAVDPVIQDLSRAARAGKPLNYGEFYQRASQLNQEAHAAYQAGKKTLGSQIDSVYQGMLKDLASVGPEAKIAAESYHNAMSGLGGMAGVKKVAAALGASGLIGGAALNPGTLMVTIPAAMAGLSFRVPGVGQALSRSVIAPDGTVIKAALPAIAQMVKDYSKEY